MQDSGVSNQTGERQTEAGAQELAVIRTAFATLAAILTTREVATGWQGNDAGMTGQPVVRPFAAGFAMHGGPSSVRMPASGGACRRERSDAYAAPIRLDRRRVRGRTALPVQTPSR